MRYLIFLLFTGITFPLWAQVQYPVTPKGEVKDTYFGKEVADPYRWLEDDRSPATKSWVQAQNSITGQYLQSIPFRDSLTARMKQLWNFPRYDAPFRCGGAYFYYRHDGLQNQPILFYMKSLQYVPMAYFDPNKISEDGTTYISNTVASNDGKYLAFLLNNSGSDWGEIRIKQVSNLKSLPEKLGWIKFSGIAWYKDGFFYSRYDAPKGGLYSGRNEYHKIYYHKLNTEQSEDSLVYEDKNHALRNFSAYVTPDERFLVIAGSESTSGNKLLYADLKKPGSGLKEIVSGFEHDFTPLGNLGGKLVFLTNRNAPKSKIILYNTALNGETAWSDLVPEQTDILKDAGVALNRLILHYMKDASSRLHVYNFQGVKTHEIPLSGLGTITELSVSPKDTNAFYSFETFTSPKTVYRYNVIAAKSFVQFTSKIPYDATAFETRQVFYYGKDSTKIPMFLVHKKGMVPDGNTPTLLFGYGGFDISKMPEFKPERLVFLEQGGLFAMPNIRGGGEYGSSWHKAGTKMQKQNVFDDFIAAAEYLISNNYTNPSKLAISGRSNGGLLVGAVMTQRPELFKVALPAVGVMDMLRYHKFTIGWAWKSDYGSSEDSTEFEALYKYSPLHNLKAEVNYPATLITTGDHDDRVVPAHSFKFAATLQEKYKGSNPVLIRIDSNAGHGAGKPTGKLIDEQADVFSFLFYNLGMTL